MGDGNHRSLILLQMLLQPVYALSIEVVGRLVEEQHVGLLQQQSAQCHAASLTAREVLHRTVACRAAQSRHRAVEFGVHVPCVGSIDDVLHLSLSLHQLVHLVGVAVIFFLTEFQVYLFVFLQGVVGFLHAFHHVLLHGLLFIERRILRQIANSVARAPHHFSLRRLHQAGYDFHECGFTCSVETYYADLGAIEERQVNVF